MIDASAATEEEGGRRKGRTRFCAVTRRALPEAALLRFVAAPDGSLVADLKAKLPGRGIWVGLDRAVVGEAVRKNVFARGLKRPLRPAVDLPDEVAAQLRKAAIGRLGLARKAGAAVAGFAKVEAAVAGARLAALLIAADAADDGRRKMEQALRRRRPDAAAVPLIRLLRSEELGLAMGLPNVIHAAVLQSPAGRSFVEAADRLQRYEGVGIGQDDDRANKPQDMVND